MIPTIQPVIKLISLDKFSQLTKKLLSVPRKEVEELEAKYQDKKKQAKPNK